MGDKGTKLGCAVAAVVACGMTSTVAVPLLVLGAGGVGSNGESCVAPLTEDSAPTILGPAILDAAALAAWWADQGRSEPASLDVTVPELVGLYERESDAEGVRGDLAFAQAVLETGYFTNGDTARNNFAGIAHPDGAPAGRAFPDDEVGVRAHIQLLKKFAAGNDALLASPDVAPRAGNRATTWDDLTGTWATAPDYWQSISSLYSEMRTHAGTTLSLGAGTDQCQAVSLDRPPAAAADGPVHLTTVRGITVNASIADQLEKLLSAARADGLLLNGHGYRSHEQQIALRRAHCGHSNYAVYETPAGQCSPPTARPGTSLHENGLAIDFSNCSTRSTRCYQWLTANAADYGLRNLPSEPWHWSTTGG